MENIQTISDISKETLTFLAFFDKEMIKKIPSNIITELCKEAADSSSDFFIDINKSFKEQKISENAKDLISLIYYDYIADKIEKEELKNKWNLNDKKFEVLQKEKYNSNNIFKNKYTEKQEENSMVKYKVSVFKKIIAKIKKLFK